MSRRQRPHLAVSNSCQKTIQHLYRRLTCTTTTRTHTSTKCLLCLRYGVPGGKQGERRSLRWDKDLCLVGALGLVLSRRLAAILTLQYLHLFLGINRPRVTLYYQPDILFLFFLTSAACPRKGDIRTRLGFPLSFQQPADNVGDSSLYGHQSRIERHSSSRRGDRPKTATIDALE